MKASEVFKKLREMSAKKKTQYIVVFIIIAIILAIYFSSLSAPETEGSGATPRQEQAAPEENLETRLSAALSRVDGAGNVEVVINYESTAELVPAISADTEESTTSDEGKSAQVRSERTSIATIKGNDEALIVKEKQPEVRGVIVVAEGAGDIAVRLALQEAVTTLLDISADQVRVLKMH